MSVRKLSSAIAAATLMGIAGQASAVPVSLDLDYMCTLPLIGDDVVAATVSSDLPETIGVGEPTGAFDLVADTTITDNSRSGLKLVNTATISGTANADAVLDTPGLNLPLTVPLAFPETTVPNLIGPFTVVAEGSTPSLTFQENQQGTVTITVGDLELIVDTRQADGSPTGLGEFTAPCSLQSSNDVLHQFEVEPPCTDGGCYLPAEIVVSIESVDFGNIQAGMSETVTVTVSNAGDETLNINSVSLTGAAEFSKSNDNCTTVAGGESCSFDVTFAPSGEGSFSGSVNIDSSDVDPTVPLSGTGELEPIPAAIFEGDLNFGVLGLGESATRSITITNDGNGFLTVDSAALQGSSDFVIVDNTCNAALANGESCAVSVTYSAHTDGASSGELVIGTNDEDNSSVSFAASAEAIFDGTGPVSPPPLIMADIEGSTFIARSGGTLPITGSIAAELTVQTGDIEADLALDPTVANFAIIKGWNSWASTAQVEFEQTRTTTGTLVSGKLKTSSEMYVYVPEVTAPIFGFDVKIGGGEDCRTSEPSVINLESADGVNISPTSGGKLSGTYNLADLENCGWLTGVVNGYMAGDGNTLNLDLSIIQ